MFVASAMNSIALLLFFMAYVFDRYLYHANKPRIILGAGVTQVCLC